MNYDDLIRSVVQDSGLNPTPWDQEGASELKINFKPDGSYTKQIQGTWKPVAQLAQKMAKGREPSPSMRGMSPEMILQFSDRRGEAGEQRKRDLGLFAGIVDKMRGQELAARKQDFAEHQYNNPDLVQIPGMPVPVPRNQVSQVLRDQAAQRLNEGRLSAEKYDLITKLLDAKDTMRTRAAQRAASYASAGRSKAASDLDRLQMQTYFNLKDFDPRLPNAMGKMSDVPLSDKGYTAGLGWETGAGTDERIGISADEKRAWDMIDSLRFNRYTKNGEPRKEPKKIEPAMVSEADRILKPFGKALYKLPYTDVGWVRGVNDTQEEAYIIIDPNQPIADILKELEVGLVSEYGIDPETARSYVLEHAKQLRAEAKGK